MHYVLILPHGRLMLVEYTASYSLGSAYTNPFSCNSFFKGLLKVVLCYQLSLTAQTDHPIVDLAGIQHPSPFVQQKNLRGYTRLQRIYPVMRRVGKERKREFIPLGKVLDGIGYIAAVWKYSIEGHFFAMLLVGLIKGIGLFFTQGAFCRKKSIYSEIFLRSATTTQQKGKQNS
jgi:hypothetical protein